jgi:DNA-binding NtrC family response regulator
MGGGGRRGVAGGGAGGVGELGTSVLAAGELARIGERRCRLVVVQGPGAGSTFELTGARTRVGKGEDAELRIPDVTVSRQHFEIRDEGGAFMLADLGSTNGTFLDGTRVKEAYLHPGMQIRAGEVVLRFVADHAELDVAPAPDPQFGALVGGSARMRAIFALLARIAPTEATLLLQGETGTGKGAVARAIHAASKRARAPFVVFDCAAVAPNLVESELFGHEKGADTGAHRQRAGALEAAQHGTLFLDEIDDLPLELQPKLLRALEDHEFQRLGSTRALRLDVRVIGASKVDLRQAAAAGRMREDLYFRLSVVTLGLPPLRERPDDVPLLCDTFLAGRGQRFTDLPRAARQRLVTHDWPGNVRELRNVLERASYMDLEQALDQSSPARVAEPAAATLSADYRLPFKEAKERLLETFEREYLRALLERAGGNVSQAARDADIDRKHLYSLLKKHGLEA